MGFEAPRKVYKLEFATEELAGLEVKVESLSIRDYVRMTELVSNVDSDKPEQEAIDDLLAGFLSCFVSWNLEQDGNPMPATIESMYSLKLDFILQIIMAWLGAIAGVSRPLPGGSPDGKQSEEEKLGLTNISQSQQS